MHSFDHLLNWKLKKGSHPFPGPDGGTCINEAAIVAAGLPYRRVRTVDSMPECFSRPICRLAMMLNDQATDAGRQRLLPYVTRLACADTKKIEKAREAYIRQHTSHQHSYYAGCDFYGGVPLTSSVPLTFDRGLEALDGALAIGRQADPLGPGEVRTWMEAARAGQFKPTRAATPVLATHKPFFSKIKSWLTMKETEPTAGVCKLCSADGIIEVASG